MVTEPLSYFLFELLVLVLLVVSIVWCLQRPLLPKHSSVLELLVFVTYGLMVESIAVASEFYSYAPFSFQVWHTPLVIGVSWGIIGISVMGVSDSLNMPQWSKPFLDALLALLIDLGMDAVAIREQYLFDGEKLGMWNWDIPFNEQWFGVPYANYMAWWLIIFLMSSCLRTGRYLLKWFNKNCLTWSYPLIAVLVATTLFAIILSTFAANFTWVVLAFVLVLSLIVVSLTIKGIQSRISWKNSLPVFLVPTAFHLFFLGLLLWHKLYLDKPAILAVSIAVFALNEVILLAIQKPNNSISNP